MKVIVKETAIEEARQQGPTLDLTDKNKIDHFCLHNPKINKFALESPETLACVFIFILTTIRTNWAQVYYVFPKVIAILTKHSSVESLFDTTAEEKRVLNAVIFGFKINAINHIWQDRNNIYNKISSILNLDESIDRDFVLYNYIIKNLSGFATPKAAFAVQLITGKYGCIDSVNTKMYAGYLDRQYNVEKGNIDSRMREYVAFLDALKASTFNTGSSELWNNWCEIVGHRMAYSVKGTQYEILVKLTKDLGSIIDTYLFTDLIRQYKEEFPEVDGGTISAQHSQLLSRDTFKESKEYLQEDYPSGFDWNHFSSLTDLKEIVKYATKQLGKPKIGSARLVWLIDDDFVLKVAKNKAGLTQNGVEMQGFIQDEYKNLVAEVIRADYENDVWIEMERVKPLSNYKQFKKFLGGYLLSNLNVYFTSHKNGDSYPEVTQKMFAIFDEIDFVQELYDFWISYDMLIGDLLKSSSWGIVVRDGKDTPVLYDFGLTKRDHAEMYHQGKVKKEFS